MKRFYRKIRSPLGICLLLFLCGLICTQVIYRESRAAAVTDAGLSTSQQDSSILSMFVGSLEQLIGDVMIMRADVYFHGMLSYTKYTHHVNNEDEDESEDNHSMLHDDSHEHEHEHHDHHHELSFKHPLFKQYQKICTTDHAHLHDSKEIVPWLAASIRLNPHNIRAFLISAYWMGMRLGDWDQAETIIREGLKHNHNNWQLCKAMGEIYFRRNQFPTALTYFSQALRSFPNTEFEDWEFELASIWRITGGTYEQLGLYYDASCAFHNVFKLQQTDQAHKKWAELLLKHNMLL